MDETKNLSETEGSQPPWGSGGSPDETKACLRPKVPSPVRGFE